MGTKYMMHYSVHIRESGCGRIELLLYTFLWEQYMSRQLLSDCMIVVIGVKLPNEGHILGDTIEQVLHHTFQAHQYSSNFSSGKKIVMQYSIVFFMGVIPYLQFSSRLLLYWCAVTKMTIIFPLADPLYGSTADFTSI